MLFAKIRAERSSERGLRARMPRASELSSTRRASPFFVRWIVKVPVLRSTCRQLSQWLGAVTYWGATDDFRLDADKP
jgi:hypothetical protein